jgi:antirestriction protein ArdC
MLIEIYQHNTETTQPKPRRPDYVKYLNHWHQLLGDDPKAIGRAASLAQKAVDYLLEREGDR